MPIKVKGGSSKIRERREQCKTAAQKLSFQQKTSRVRSARSYDDTYDDVEKRPYSARMNFIEMRQ